MMRPRQMCGTEAPQAQMVFQQFTCCTHCCIIRYHLGICVNGTTSKPVPSKKNFSANYQVSNHGNITWHFDAGALGFATKHCWSSRLGNENWNIVRDKGPHVPGARTDSPP